MSDARVQSGTAFSVQAFAQENACQKRFLVQRQALPHPFPLPLLDRCDDRRSALHIQLLRGALVRILDVHARAKLHERFDGADTAVLARADESHAPKLVLVVRVCTVLEQDPREV